MNTKNLLLSILCSMIWFSAFSTESEPNDTKPQANTLTLNSSNTGVISPATTDVDWWKVTTNSDGQLSISLTISNGLYCWAALYDNDGTTLLGSGNTNGTATVVTKDGLAVGTYFIKVYPYYSAQMPSYTISNTLTNAAFTNDNEPNGTKATALTLGLNSSVNGHSGYYYNLVRDSADWYSVTTNGDGRLRLRLTSSNGQFIWAYLYDNNGTTLLNSNNTSGTLDISTDGLAAGTYYVKIKPYYGSGFIPYTLADSLFTPTQANDAEPNDTKAQAKTLAQGGSKTGHVNYYYNVHRDSADWYKITTNADGRLDLTLTSGNGQFVWAYLYDNNGTTLLSSDNTSSTVVISKNGLAAGIYYVKVKAYYGTGFIPYSISNTLTTPAEANDAEPNGTTGEALSFSVNSSVTGHSNYYYNGVYDAQDWHRIVTTADGMINISITSGNGQYIWAYLYDNDGTTLLNSANTSGTTSYNTDGLAAGTYYVMVKSYYSTGYVPYTLSNTLSQYTNANDGLSNDYAKYAATLVSNTATQGHVGFWINGGGGSRDPRDWWKINYTGTGALTVTLNWENFLYNGGTHYVYLRVYKDTAQAAIYNQNSSSGTLTANLTALTKGYYYVAVIPYYSTQWAAYNLTPTFTEDCAVVTVKAKNKVSGTTCTNSSVKINCTGNNGPYRVQLYRNGSPYGDLLPANGSGDVQYNNLPPGSYTGRGYADGSSCGTLSTAAKLVPVPTSPFTSNITQTSVKLNWTTLTSCIEQSKVQYRVVGTATWTNKKINNTNQFVTINNLPHNTSYEWQVASVDTIGGSTTTNVSAYVPGANFTTLVKLGSSLDEQTTVLNVYPNPASSNVHVIFENGIEGEVTMKLFDVSGRTIFAHHQNEASGKVNEEIDLSSLNAGVYALQIITADGSVLNQSIVKTNE